MLARWLQSQAAYKGRNILSWKLKKVMLKTDARYVPGRKSVPMSEMVFMAVLSRLLAWAMRRCSPAISRLSLASRCDMMLYN